MCRCAQYCGVFLLLQAGQKLHIEMVEERIYGYDSVCSNEGKLAVRAHILTTKIHTTFFTFNSMKHRLFLQVAAKSKF